MNEESYVQVNKKIYEETNWCQMNRVVKKGIGERKEEGFIRKKNL